jgi:tRNA(Ile)-lysidine synthase TilS/MesJ
MPSTKPDLHLDGEGVCNACRSFENRKKIDWSLRRTQLLGVLDKFRNKNGSNWDCIVPVSGGKDSTFQVIQMLELWKSPGQVFAGLVPHDVRRDLHTDRRSTLRSRSPAAET